MTYVYNACPNVRRIHIIEHLRRFSFPFFHSILSRKEILYTAYQFQYRKITVIHMPAVNHPSTPQPLEERNPHANPTPSSPETGLSFPSKSTFTH
jgi:hypothetical protein